MSELTVRLDDRVTDILEQMARERSVPLSDFVAESLETFAKQHKVRKRLRELIETSPIPLEPGWKWNREELYDRAVFGRHERDSVRDDGTGE